MEIGKEDSEPRGRRPAICRLNCGLRIGRSSGSEIARSPL